MQRTKYARKAKKVAADSAMEAAARQELLNASNMDYIAPSGYSFSDLFDMVRDGGYTTVAAKTGDQQLANTIMVFFSDLDPVHSFVPNYIQTRYNEMVIDLKLELYIELSDLDWKYMEACEERRRDPTNTRARVEYVVLWHRSKEDFHTLNDLEIRIFVHKLAKSYAALKKLEGDISVAMTTGVVDAEDEELNTIRYAISGLESLLGEYVKVCKESNTTGIDMMELAASLAVDPLSVYMEQTEQEREGAEDHGETAGQHGNEEAEEDDPVDEYGWKRSETKMLEDALRKMHMDEDQAKAAEAALKADAIAQATAVSLQDVLNDIEALGDNFRGMTVNEGFADVMNMLDKVSIVGKVDILKKNADKVVEGLA